MIFGEVDTRTAEGAVLGHSLRLEGLSRPKGHRLSAADVALMLEQGVSSVIVGRLDPDDCLENDAAARIADAIAAPGLTFSMAATGRVNVFAAVDGLFVAERVGIDRLNRIDPAITLACLNDHVPVIKGDMVATIKIIPLAVAGALVERAAALLKEAQPFAVKPFSPLRTLLISTQLPTLKPSVMDKTRRVLDARLRRYGSPAVTEVRVAHTASAVARALEEHARDYELAIVFGASAVADPLDVIPAAISAAGGTVVHVGMPVDPGNLLVLGRLDDIPVIGAPGCARSPKENGFDWILQRILAGERPDGSDIMAMGVGGLLMEIAARPQPRDIAEATHKPPSVATVVLAAGRASRMGVSGHHKLLAEFDGVPLVRRTVETAREACGGPVTVVTGHRDADIRAALDGMDMQIAFNPDYASGMASSLIAGLDAVDPATQGLMVMLADMPAVTAEHLTAMLEAFRAEGGDAIVRAVDGDKRGNPVILPRATFSAIRHLSGDVGARQIIETSGLPVIDIDIGVAARLDLDTTEAVLSAGGILKG